MLAGCLVISSGCGVDRPKPPAVAEEPRHPSNEMIPLKKVEPEATEAPKAASVKHPAPKPRVPVFEDPRKIPTGIQFAELVRRFGPPSMKVVDGPARTTFSYSKLKTQVQVEVQNGKVVSVASVNTGF
jgi:outer membrane biosynthesis protein TonB